MPADTGYNSTPPNPAQQQAQLQRNRQLLVAALQPWQRELMPQVAGTQTPPATNPGPGGGEFRTVEDRRQPPTTQLPITQLPVTGNNVPGTPILSQGALMAQGGLAGGLQGGYGGYGGALQAYLPWRDTNRSRMQSV